MIVDEYGKNVVSNRSATGTGMAASDKRIKKSQRSYESGTGPYQVDDRMELHGQGHKRLLCTCELHLHF